MSSQPSDNHNIDLLLHQYDTIVSLYKHHLDLVFKINLFVYAVTGSILSFYFATSDVGIVKYSLLFPTMMNLFFSVFFFHSATKIWPFDRDMKEIIRALGFISSPDIMVLKRILNLSAVLYLTIGIGLSFTPLLK